MDEVEFNALAHDLETLPIAAVVADLTTRHFVVVNEKAASEVYGAPASELVGTDALDHVHPADRAAAEIAFTSLEAQSVEGYQAHRRFLRPDGSDRMINIWGRRLDAPGGPFGLWMMLPDDDDDGVAVGQLGAKPIVLGLTDHDWVFDYVSSDSTLLGHGGSAIVGKPLLGFVHPSVAPEFLDAAGRAVANRIAVTVRTRLYCAREGWADRYCLLVPMCEHEPPRLGVVVTEARVDASPSGNGVQPRVEHAALEARAVDALHALPVLAGRTDLPELSARQIEILARLIDGEGVEEIAGGLYLSQSTVRNHLTALYRKFGVHSRAELLAALLRAAAPTA